MESGQTLMNKIQNSKQNPFRIWKIKILNLFRIWDLGFRISRNEGFGLLEMVISVAVVITALVGFLETERVSLRLFRTEKDNLEATFLAQEGLEAARILRDQSWTNNVATLTSGSVYYSFFQNNAWSLSVSSPGLIDEKYTRTLVFNNVFRNLQDKISPSGTADPNTKQVISSISWNIPTGSKQQQLTSYLTNFQGYLQVSNEAKTIYYDGADTDADLAGFPSNNSGDGDVVQSFTTSSMSLQATKIELLMRRVTSNPSNIFAEIRTSPTGTVLGATAVFNSSLLPLTPAWTEFRFSLPVSLAASTKYYLRLRSIPSSTDPFSGSVGTIYWSYRQTSQSPYAEGEAIRYVGRLSNPNDAGQTMSQYDFGFRVYALQ